MAKSSSTAESINPYIEILQLDPQECPPDRYALLGLQRYTSDSKLIEAAATEQIRYVRPFCARYPTEGTQLLNELTKAKLCLLDDQERASYDTELRQSENVAGIQHVAGGSDDKVEWIADLFGDDLDEQVETKTEDLSSRCPHCGSGLFKNDKYCQSCAGGLADRGSWLSAKCPECRQLLARGAVVCKMCHADLSITDVIGYTPSHVPGSIRPFECQNRKKQRAARQRAMQAWSQESKGKSPEETHTDDVPEASASKSPNSQRELGEQPLPRILTLLLNAINVICEKAEIDGDIVETVVPRYRATVAWCRERNLSVGTIAKYAAVGSIPFLGLYVILLLSGSGSESPNDTQTIAAAQNDQALNDSEQDNSEDRANPSPQDKEPALDVPGSAEAPQEAMVVPVSDSPPPKMAEEPKSEAELKYEELAAKASDVTADSDLNDVERIRAVLQLIREAETLEKGLDTDSTVFLKLNTQKIELIETGAAGLCSLLIQLRRSRRIDHPQYVGALALLNDPETFAFKESGSWYRLEENAKTLVNKHALHTLEDFSTEAEFDDAFRYVQTAQAPKLIGEYTPQLTSLLENVLVNAINKYSSNVQQRAISLATRSKVEEGLNELAKLKSGKVGEQLSQYSAGYFESFAQAVLMKADGDESSIDPSALKAVIAEAESYSNLRDSYAIQMLRAKLARTEVLAKVSTVTNKREALELLETPDERRDFDEAFRLLVFLKDKYRVGRNGWYVVSLGSGSPIRKYNNRYQAAAVMILGRSALGKVRLMATACTTEAAADALLLRGGEGLHPITLPVRARPARKRSR